MARVFVWLILVALIGGMLGVLALPFMLLQAQPRVEAKFRLNPPEVERAKALLAEHNPRRLRDGDVRALELRADELSLVLNYMLDQLGGGASQVTVSDQALSAQLTWTLSQNPIGRYLNLDVVLMETGGIPAIDTLRIGQLKIPALLANPVLAIVSRFAYARAGLPAPDSLLKRAEFVDSRVILRYQWHTELVQAVREQLVPVEEAARLYEFHLQLLAITRHKQHALTLSELAAPLFAFGVERAASGDPVADNRAALLVLSSYVTGHRLNALVPGAADWPAPPRLTVRVHGRRDLVKHFLNTAALAATGGHAVAHAIGLAKEINDSSGGSGFSFVDLLANEAGTRFGQRATESRVVAREIQKRAADATQDLDWIPAPDGLREQVAEAEFNRRYGGIEGAGYRQVLSEINRRITTVALYR